jgi:hypothetical protein
MVSISIVHWVVVGALGLFFLGNGAFELTRWRTYVDDFTRWGYPRYWPLVTCLLKIAFAVLMFIPPVQILGLVGAAALLVAGLGTLIYRREPEAAKAAPPVLVFLALIVVALFTRPA